MLDHSAAWLSGEVLMCLFDRASLHVYRFNKVMEIESTVDFEDPAILRFVVDRALRRGRDGYTQVCA